MEIFDGLLVDGEDLDRLLLGDFVDHDPHKLEVLCEIHRPAELDHFLHGSFDQLVGEPALNLHEAPQHVVVGVAWKHDLARVELVETARNGPQVDGIVVLETECDLRRTIPPRYQVRGDVTLINVRPRPKVAHLGSREGLDRGKV